MMDWVYEGIYIGDIQTLRQQDTVAAEGINAVVRLDLRDRDERHWDERFIVADMPIRDEANLPDDIIEQGTAFIAAQLAAGKTILVHCNMGISRSTSLVMAYLIEYEGMSLGEAFGTVREGRTQAFPHAALLTSLIYYYDLPYTLQDAYSPHFLSRLMQDA